jgi:hypothetical protein
MKANEAIDKLKIRQEEMMREANKMARRAKELQAIAECQDIGYRWKVVEVDLSHDKMKANRIRLICEKSHVQIDAILINPPPLTVMTGDEDTELSVYLGGEEE